MNVDLETPGNNYIGKRTKYYPTLFQQLDKLYHDIDSGKFGDTAIENPITVGLLTGMLPCASSLAVVMMTGMTPSFISIIRFIMIYVLGIALVLFLIVTTFNFTKNIILKKFNNIQFNFNQEIISGCLILAVGLIYLGYNWSEHIH